MLAFRERNRRTDRGEREKKKRTNPNSHGHKRRQTYWEELESEITNTRPEIEEAKMKRAKI